MTSDLVAFLKARIDEDDADARASLAALPSADWSQVSRFEIGGPYEAVVETSDAGPGVLPHISRWQPARVLAECEAKRWIVNWIAGELADDPDCVMENEALRVLAAPYSAHPDFDASWGGPT